MDSLLSLVTREEQLPPNQKIAPREKRNFDKVLPDPKQLKDSILIQKTLTFEYDPAALVSFSVDSLSKALSITGQEIVEKLNELLKKDLPEGIESLNPEEYTPEATAERIVQGATAFFGVYAQQNPELEGEELLDSFMKTIRSGIDRGYDEAFKTLEGLGAFGIDGIQGGVEQTKSLIEEKLLAYEAQKKVALGISDPPVEQKVAEGVTAELLKESGSRTLNTFA